MVTKVRWANPHVVIILESTTANGSKESWQLVGSAINMLERRGVKRATLKTGDRIRARGPVARNGSNSLVAGSLLMPDGQQVVLFGRVAELVGLIKPEQTSIGFDKKRSIEKVAADKNGLFRIWTPRTTPRTDKNIGLPTWALTEFAWKAVEVYDPLNDDPAIKCIQAGMPVILDTPYPIAFDRRGEDIVLRTEEWDTERVIHMYASVAKQESAEPSIWGYSIGRWEADTLVISTARISYPFFDDLGTPQTGNLKMEERYRISPEEGVLVWEASFIDPIVFKEKIQISGDIVYYPNETIKKFNCTLASEN